MPLRRVVSGGESEPLLNRLRPALDDAFHVDLAIAFVFEYDQRYDAWVLAVPAHARAAAKSLIEDHDLRNVPLVTWSIDFGGLPR